jgi:hypothetical protein
MLLSMGLTVLADLPVYLRIIAWSKLVKVWACLRTDDLLQVDFNRMVLTAEGLSMIMKRTKTTGPGRRMQEVGAFVSSKADITECGWLGAGYRLVTSGEFGRERDYLLPRVGRGLIQPIWKRATYVDLAANGRAVLRWLRVPCRVTEDGL